jgi:hypothetical protein
MRRSGYESGPFQLFIGIIVFSMALGIGAYLFDMVNCWKCNELLKIQAKNLQENIGSLGDGSGSKIPMMIQLEDLGSCAKGIYIRQFKEESGLQCSSFCPQHQQSCWVVMWESSCGGKSLDFDGCIDISGDTVIDADPDLLGMLDSNNNALLVGAYAIYHTTPITIERTGPKTISIHGWG